ncbi:FAD-dependent thymidylate synthase [Dactylosporangium sp. CA-139066]|uniref:FAD-dependent thymidylate synthase n=1 Tax=Dactylosporangium sp. CA-139066 TaxID=3239930 RepID=UPI003D93A255
MKTAKPAVKVLAFTWFDAEVAEAETGWRTDARGGEALAEFAGRDCYQSWSKPNPATATNAGYLAHILEVGHLSVLEHGTVTMRFTGVSRSFSHELVRHRHFSYSQLSQRYVPAADTAMVLPPLFGDDSHAAEILAVAAEQAMDAYEEMTKRAEELLGDRGVPAGTSRRKQARQAARAVLPNMAETKIVVTGNYRAWRHFIDLRATVHADVEIREVAILALRALQRVAPNVFADYTITTLDDGTEVAASPYAERS